MYFKTLHACTWTKPALDYIYFLPIPGTLAYSAVAIIIRKLLSNMKKKIIFIFRDLSNNLLSSVPTSVLGHLGQLTWVDLSRNQISNLDWKHFEANSLIKSM
jgi:hypothetical protein